MRNNYFFFFFFNDTATTEIYTLSLHDALPIWYECSTNNGLPSVAAWMPTSCTAVSEPPARLISIFSTSARSEEHTSELQSHSDLVCRLLLEKKNIRIFLPNN